MGRKKRDTQSGHSLPHTEYVQQLRDMLAEHGTAIKAKNAIEKAKESFGKEVTASTFKITLTYARMYLIEGGVMDGSKHGYW